MHGDPRPQSMVERVRRTVRTLRSTHAWQRADEIELMHRAMGFAALGFVTLVPLLIVIAAVAPLERSGFGQWVVTGLGLAGESAHTVVRLFPTPSHVLSTTTAFSLAALAVFGLTFGQAVQVAYERIWRMRPGRWHTRWRPAVWLAGLMGYLFFEAQLSALLNGSPLEPVDGAVVTCLSGIAFFWWSQRMLLTGRVSWRRLLPGSVATVLGLVGLRLFSALVFAPLIVSNAVTYGPIGTVLMVQSWMIGVGFVVYGGALVGQLLDERQRGGPGKGGSRAAGRRGATGAASAPPPNDAGGTSVRIARAERGAAKG